MYKLFRVWLCLFAALVFAACGPNEGVLKSGRPNAETANITPAPATLEQDLADVRDANCRFVYILRRRDGEPLSAEDRAFLRQPTNDAKRRVSTQGGRAIIIGSDFQIPPDAIPGIYDRFAVEDFSIPR